MNNELNNAVHMLEECSANIQKNNCRLSDEWKTASGEIIQIKAEKICSAFQNIAENLMEIVSLEGEEK